MITGINVDKQVVEPAEKNDTIQLLRDRIAELEKENACLRKNLNQVSIFLGEMYKMMENKQQTSLKPPKVVGGIKIY